MKWLKRTGILLLALPFFLVAIFIVYEIFGMYVNHRATKRQTNQLQQNLMAEIPDIQLIDVHSETGNTSGTGNHVDCLSVITFSTQMQESELISHMSQWYTFDEWSCYITKTQEGNYLFYLNTSAPFANNIEGH